MIGIVAESQGDAHLQGRTSLPFVRPHVGPGWRKVYGRGEFIPVPTPPEVSRSHLGVHRFRIRLYVRDFQVDRTATSPLFPQLPRPHRVSSVAPSNFPPWNEFFEACIQSESYGNRNFQDLTIIHGFRKTFSFRTVVVCQSQNRRLRREISNFGFPTFGLRLIPVPSAGHPYRNASGIWEQWLPSTSACRCPTKLRCRLPPLQRCRATSSTRCATIRPPSKPVTCLKIVDPTNAKTPPHSH